LSTTSADNGATLTCELIFYIPSRSIPGHQEFIRRTGRRTLSRRGAQFSTVHDCLEALQHVCYHVPNFSHFKYEALLAGDIPVWQVCEHYASYNQTDVVKSTSLVMYCLLLMCNNDLSFFGFAHLQLVLHDTTYAGMALSVILDQAIQRLGYNWEYCSGNHGQQTTEGRQFCIRFTNGANGSSVGYIYGRPCLRSWEV
jgi:hypothetical protein